MSRRSFVGVLSAGAAFVSMGSLGSAQDATPEATPGGTPVALRPPLGTTWKLLEITRSDGTTLVPDNPLNYTIRLAEDGQLFALLDCNGGGGSYKLSGSSLVFGDIFSTLMACPEGSIANEFSAALGKVRTFELKDGDLFLATETDGKMLHFTPAYLGVTWQWSQIADASGAFVDIEEPSRYTITFNSDGSLSAQVDCNRGKGSFSESGGALTIGPIATTRMGCPEDSMAFQFTDDLAKVVGYTVGRGQLRLQLPNDAGALVFSPAEATAGATPEATPAA